MLGKRIKELRLSLGLNQIEFGEILNVTKQSVSNWENENILPSIEILLKIVNHFSVSADYLLGLSQHRCIEVDGLSDRQISYIQSLVDDLKAANKPKA